jgi:hypothetical protein
MKRASNPLNKISLDVQVENLFDMPISNTAL